MKDISILSKRQQQAWQLREQGLSYGKIAKEMGISYSGAVSHIRYAERRFREYEAYCAARERNLEVLQVEITRGELKILIEALDPFEVSLGKGVPMDSRVDWMGHLPYKVQIVQQLKIKLREVLSNRKVHEEMKEIMEADSR